MDVRHLDAHRHHIPLPSADLSYLDLGTGPAALFLHGAGTNAHLWAGTLAALTGDGDAAGLAGRRRCIALDLPLHGHSAAREHQDFSLGGLAGVVEEFCAALGLDQVDLVAHDTGGAIAQVFAVRHPQRLRTLTLTNCDTHDNLPPAPFAPIVELARRGELAAAGQRLLADPQAARSGPFGGGFEHPELVSDAAIRGYFNPIFGTEQAGRTFERFLLSLHAADLVAIEPELKQLTTPTLVAWGTADTSFELRWAYWLRDTIPGVVEVVEIEGGRLFYPAERGPELAGHLVRHWNR